MIDRARLLEVARYIINGLFATGAHYLAFLFNLHALTPNSAGLANFLASFFGITISFLGSRYFVFRNWRVPIGVQFLRFGTLYAAIAILSGATLFIWSDIFFLNKTVGFFIGVILQVCFSYLGSRRLVFA
jgi:putative flippase GtrA